MNSSIKIKICGITRLEDAIHCAELGVDALGFVFYKNSKRYIEPEQVRNIIQCLPPFINTVGLFVDSPTKEICNVLQKVPLQILQFHGNEDEKYCSQFNRPYMKAVRIKKQDNLYQIEKDFASAIALLYDSYSETEFGGTGKSFDWNMIPENLTKPWVLAGGINPENIVQAIYQTKAKSIDVSSGVESDFGIKDRNKIRALISGVKIARLSLPG